MQRKKVKNKYILIGILLVLISFIIIVLRNLEINKKRINEQKLINQFFDKSFDESDITDQDDDNNNADINNNNDKSFDNVNDLVDEEYVAVIEIPKISLKKGLYNQSSINNDVNKNIKILSSSAMPDEDGSNLILASHAGSSNASYFKNLSKLSINDYIYLFYNRRQYVYSVNKIFEIEKDGIIDINKNNNNKLLTLITCKIGMNKQIVVIAKLVNEEEF